MIRSILLTLVLLMLNSSALAATINDVHNILNNFKGHVGVYAINLKTGLSISYNADAVFPTASTSKLLVTLAVYKNLYPAASEKEKVRYDRYVSAMITVSDNATFYELLNELSYRCPAGIKNVCNDLRLKNTRIHDDFAFQKYHYHSVTSPYDMAIVAQAIYDGSYLDQEKSEYVKDKMANTIFTDEIPRYINSKVMHKVGELDNILCDVGIVDDGIEPIIISFYTSTDQNDPYASNFIASASAKIYEVLRKPGNELAKDE